MHITSHHITSHHITSHTLSYYSLNSHVIRIPSHPILSPLHLSTGYDFEHINKKRTGEQMSAHAQKYCELLIHHVADEDDEWGDRSLLTFSGWLDSEAGASELSRGYYLEQIKRWLQVIDRRLVITEPVIPRIIYIYMPTSLPLSLVYPYLCLLVIDRRSVAI